MGHAVGLTGCGELVQRPVLRRHGEELCQRHERGREDAGRDQDFDERESAFADTDALRRDWSAVALQHAGAAGCGVSTAAEQVESFQDDSP